MPDPLLAGRYYSVWKTRHGSLSVECNDPLRALHEMAHELHTTKQKLIDEIARATDREMEIEHLRGLGICLSQSE